MNYYEILGVDRGAEQEVIDAAFRAMMRRYHPDTFVGPKDEAERRAKLLNEAYSVLRDPGRRAAYDETLGPLKPHAASVNLQLPTPQVSQLSNTALKLLGGISGLAALAALLVTVRSDLSPPAPLVTSAGLEPAPVSHSQVPSPASSPSLFVASASASCRGMECRVMTPFGWGGIEAGVSIDSAQAASGMKIRDDGHYTEFGDGSCLAFEVVGGPKNLQMLVENGEVTTVEAYLDADAPTFMTDRGVRLGDPEAAVRKAYQQLKQLPDIYSEPPDKKLFYYEPGGERGIKFSINGGKVTGI